MIFEKSPLQLYTPPTCTLKLWDKRSLLSRWREKITLENLGFELHFDDPRLIEEEQVTIKGDHTQLALLHSVVGSYVQQFLYQTSSCLIDQTPCLAESMTPENGENSDSEASSFLPTDPPSLTPKGLLTHRLNLGFLATQATHSSVNLSVSQLFDLLNALEAYSDNILDLTSPYGIFTKQNIWVWTGATAAAILALLIPTVGVQWYQQQSSLDLAVDESPENGEDERSFLNVLPPVPPPPKEPLPPPSLAPNLANRDPLPPPSQISQATPPPRNPNVAIQAPPVRVLPPPPTAPAAPPKPGTANPAPAGNTEVPVHLLPNGETPTVMPALPPETVTQMMAQQPPLPPPPTLQGRSPNQTAPTDTLSVPNELLPDNAQPPVQSPPNMSLLDAIPQVAEVRQYFQQRWQPPEDLVQSLEYRLVVQNDGSLKQAIPLGKAATLYLQQTGMPAPGDNFVSSLDVANDQTIRLVLNQNGTVKTFLE
ncbi:MAG: DUF4335 domain-containing protein [Cyanobacteria bacterium P01_G01_bin.49]